MGEVVENANRYGEPIAGIRLTHIPCPCCNSTGLVRAGLAPACCCSRGGEKCDGCRDARRGGAEIHNCRERTQEELAYETELALADTPATAPRSAAADALDVSTGPRT